MYTKLAAIAMDDMKAPAPFLIMLHVSGVYSFRGVEIAVSSHDE